MREPSRSARRGEESGSHRLRAPHPEDREEVRTAQPRRGREAGLPQYPLAWPRYVTAGKAGLPYLCGGPMRVVPRRKINRSVPFMGAGRFVLHGTKGGLRVKARGRTISL